MRFLIQNRFWKGLVIDGSEQQIGQLRDSDLMWKVELTAIAKFITAKNINDKFVQNDFKGEIGILSIDIDGNDYWVWRAIEAVSPHIVIVEYNALFGNKHPLTIPYDPVFTRSKADSSMLYYGASCAAFAHLAAEKGYVPIVSNHVGSNYFSFARTAQPSLLTKSAIVDRGRVVSARPAPVRAGCFCLAAGRVPS